MKNNLWSEYAVEVFKNERFVRQIDIFRTFKSAKDFIKSNQINVDQGESVCITQINYEGENEIEHFCVFEKCN